MHAIGRAAIGAEIAFSAIVVVVAWVDDAPLHATVSDLVRGPHGPWVTVAFLLHSAALAAVAWLWRASRIRYLLLLAAAAMLTAGIFPTQPLGERDWTGIVHLAAAGTVFGCIAVAAILRRGPWPLRALDAVVVLGTGVLAAVAWSDAPGLGLAEAVQVGLNGLWVISATGGPRRFSTWPVSRARDAVGVEDEP